MTHSRVFISLLHKLAITMALLLAGSSAHSADYFVTFQVDLLDGFGPIDNIVLFDRYESGSGLSWPYSVGEGGGEFTNPFPYSETPVEFLVYGLIMDEINGNRVVLFMNDATSDFAEGKEWSTLFPGNPLEVLIAGSIEAVASGEDGPGKDTSVSTLTAFGEVDATSIPGPESSTLSAYFTVGQSFKVVAFSTGEIIGSGTSFATPVPEPSTWALGAVAVTGLAVAGRRSRRAKSI